MQTRHRLPPQLRENKKSTHTSPCGRCLQHTGNGHVSPSVSYTGSSRREGWAGRSRASGAFHQGPPHASPPQAKARLQIPREPCTPGLCAPSKRPVLAQGGRLVQELTEGQAFRGHSPWSAVREMLQGAPNAAAHIGKTRLREKPLFQWPIPEGPGYDGLSTVC